MPSGAEAEAKHPLCASQHLRQILSVNPDCAVVWHQHNPGTAPLAFQMARTAWHQSILAASSGPAAVDRLIAFRLVHQPCKFRHARYREVSPLAPKQTSGG